MSSRKSSYSYRSYSVRTSVTTNRVFRQRKVQRAKVGVGSVGNGGWSDYNRFDGLSSLVGGSGGHTQWPILVNQPEPRHLPLRIPLPTPSHRTGIFGLLGNQQEIDKTLFCRRLRFQPRASNLITRTRFSYSSTVENIVSLYQTRILESILFRKAYVFVFSKTYVCYAGCLVRIEEEVILHDRTSRKYSVKCFYEFRYMQIRYIAFVKGCIILTKNKFIIIRSEFMRRVIIKFIHCVVYKLPRVAPLFVIDARNISPRQTCINHFRIQMIFVEHSSPDSQTESFQTRYPLNYYSKRNSFYSSSLPRSCLYHFLIWFSHVDTEINGRTEDGDKIQRRAFSTISRTIYCHIYMKRPALRWIQNHIGTLLNFLLAVCLYKNLL